MSDPFIAEIVMIGANFAPRSWALCDGQILPINQNQSLFSLLGTTYGGDGRTTFALPELRGRVPVGVGTGPGLPEITWGEKSGTENNTLQAANLPAHTHGVAASVFRVKNDTGDQATPAGASFANEGRGTDMRYQTAAGTTFLADGAVSVTVNNSGNQQPLNNVQPFQVVNYIICMQGLFPSRN